MKKIIIIGILTICVILYCLYYFYPRKVSFNLAMVIPKPHEKFDETPFVGFHYVSNEERLMFWFVDKLNREYSHRKGGLGFDSTYTKKLSDKLDYTKYDYVITYHKRLKALTYSPYLAKKEDACGYLKEKPLIPTFDNTITDSIYIYRISKNTKYRSPCP